MGAGVQRLVQGRPVTCQKVGHNSLRFVKVLTPRPGGVETRGHPVGQLHPRNGTGGDIGGVEHQALGFPVVAVGHQW